MMNDTLTHTHTNKQKSSGVELNYAVFGKYWSGKGKISSTFFFLLFFENHSSESKAKNLNLRCEVSFHLEFKSCLCGGLDLLDLPVQACGY